MVMVRQTVDGADVSRDRVFREISHPHVFDHPLSQGCHRVLPCFSRAMQPVGVASREVSLPSMQRRNRGNARLATTGTTKPEGAADETMPLTRLREKSSHDERRFVPESKWAVRDPRSGLVQFLWGDAIAIAFPPPRPSPPTARLGRQICRLSRPIIRARAVSCDLFVTFTWRSFHDRYRFCPRWSGTGTALAPANRPPKTTPCGAGDHAPWPPSATWSMDLRKTGSSTSDGSCLSWSMTSPEPPRGWLFVWPPMRPPRSDGECKLAVQCISDSKKTSRWLPTSKAVARGFRRRPAPC